MRTMVAGMGLMGSALADALLQQGLPVTVWNRTPERCRAAVEAGATQASSFAEGAQNCDVLISCLTDHEAVTQSVITSDVGEALAGKAFVQLSQATPDQSLTFADWAARHGIGYLDGSILGYPKDVRAGDCFIIYSGDPAVFETCHDVLHAMGAKPRLVGEKPGVATAFDKAYFAFYYAHAVGLLHGAAICRASGVPLDGFLDLMVEAYDWRAADRISADALKSGDLAAREATLETHAHAYNQVALFSRSVGADTGLADAMDRLFQAGIDLGHGRDEIAALIEVLNPRRD